MGRRGRRTHEADDDDDDEEAFVDEEEDDNDEDASARKRNGRGSQSKGKRKAVTVNGTKRVRASKRHSADGDAADDDDAAGADDNADDDDDDDDDDEDDTSVWEVRKIVKRARKGKEAPEDVADLAPVDRKKLVGHVMRYVLYLNMNNAKCTTAKVSENAIKPTGIKVNAKQKAELLAIVTAKFKDTFGYDLVSTSDAPLLEADRRQALAKRRAKRHDDDDEDDEDDEPARAKKSGDNWVLLNLLESQSAKKEMWKDRDDNHLRGLAMVVLAFIMLKDGVVRDEVLHKQLEKVGVPLPPEPGVTGRKGSGDRTFANSKVALRALEDANYVARRKCAEQQDSGSIAYEYEYGPKAMLEIGLPNVLRFLEKFTGAQLKPEDREKIINGDI